MTKFLLIRHGHSTAGESIPGRTPAVPLSQDGIRQARILAEKLVNLHVDYIYASPLDRTKQTAEIIAQQIKKPVELIPELMEIDFGEWTGKTFKELDGNKKWHLWHSFRTGTRIPGGELSVQVQARMVSVIEDLTNRHADKTVAVVSHGDPIRSVICHYAGISIDNMLKIRIDTASLTIFQIDQYWAEFVCINTTFN
jgi:broad specificity phosphatase PhoE